MNQSHLEHLLCLWQRRLGLTGWSVLLKTEDAPEVNGHEVLFKCDRSTFYENASISVHKGVYDHSALPDSIEKDQILAYGDEYIETELVHELLHLHLRDLVKASDLIRDHLAPPAVDVWDGAWIRAEEAMVDRLAHALVRGFNDER